MPEEAAGKNKVCKPSAKTALTSAHRNNLKWMKCHAGAQQAHGFNDSLPYC